MRKSRLLQIVFFGLFWLACQKENSTVKNPPDNYVPFNPQFLVADLLMDSHYESNPQTVGQVKHVYEASGLDISFSNEGALWTHNDHGNREYIFLIDGNSGEKLQTYFLRNVQNIDWEDISTHYDSLSGKSFIYLADIGNNQATRSSFRIYRFEEPVWEKGTTQDTLEVFTIVDIWQFEYPGAAALNAECMFYDELGQRMIIVSQEAEQSRVFALPLNGSEVNYLGKLPFGGVTAGDLNAKRTKLALKTFDNILLWDVLHEEPLEAALQRLPRRLPYQPEPQGEAFCWQHEHYFTLSESSGINDPQLYFYKKK